MAGPTGFVFYHYEPSMVAAVIFIAGFGISTLLHLKTLVQKRTWYFIPFILGCICEYMSPNQTQLRNALFEVVSDITTSNLRVRSSVD